ncbi:hypothetical protein [Paenibacillus sp. FSL L8-0463]|uniref:hypothetical protein n=1 Tax=Paenibacillus sp. FSL L8-0463 TaxID=2954687 RepID=UPI0031198F83
MNASFISSSFDNSSLEVAGTAFSSEGNSLFFSPNLVFTTAQAIAMPIALFVNNLMTDQFTDKLFYPGYDPVT